jgi:hypothetical protein
MKANKQDYCYKRFNHLTIIDLVPDNNNHTMAVCKCDCGNLCTKKLSMVKIGHVTSCGCVGASNLFTKNTNRYIVNDFSDENIKSAYWAGFLFGDGNIDNNNKLQVCLGLESKKHLIKLSHFIVGEDITRIYRDRCTLQITSDKIAHNLSIYGIIPRKTYHSTLTLPKNTNLHKHFIRGYLDADGWISVQIDKRSKATYTSHLIGICSYLAENLDIVSRHLPVETIKLPRKIPRRNLYELRYSRRNDVISILKYLFDENIYLEYKWDKVLHLIK